MSVTGAHAGVDPVRLLSNPPVVRHGSLGKPRSVQVLAAAAGCLLLGCLPVGNPPAGRHVIAGRTISGVYLSPSEVNGVPSNLLVTGPMHEIPPAGTDLRPELALPLANLPFADLYAVPYADIAGTKSGLAGWQPVVGDFLVSYQTLTHGMIPTDSLGRLIVAQYSSVFGLLNTEQVDLATGAARYLGTPDLLAEAPVFLLSSARTRVFVGGSGPGRLCDLDACQSIDNISKNIAFVGEDFYYTDGLPAASGVPAGNLYRLKPHAQPEVLLSFTGVVSFQRILGDSTPQLLLSLATDTGDAPFALFDTDTLNTTSLPPEKGQAQFVSASSDGHWLAFLVAVPTGDSSQPADHRLFLYNWVAGAFAIVDSTSAGQGIGTTIEWRPGRPELWISTLPDGFLIWRPDADLTTVQATLYPYIQAPYGKPSAFTRDGRHWFSTGTGQRPTIYVGLADDATAPQLPLNPRGTVTTTHWETDDGRLLVGAWTIDENRKDIYLVDADAGTSRAIASAGHLVALGHTRALALLNWEISRLTGDLTLVDLASGAHTVLAEDVYDLAVDRGKSADVSPGGDALAPGTRVAFVTRNRLASPYDGLWVASLP